DAPPGVFPSGCYAATRGTSAAFLRLEPAARRRPFGGHALARARKRRIHLPLPWFRRKKQTREQYDAENAPAADVTPPAPPSNEQPSTAAAAEAARKRRRRGSRGGKNRRKPASAAAPAATEKAAAPTSKAPAKETPQGERRSRSSTRRRQPARRAPLPAAKRELLVSVDVTEQRVAVLEDGRVAEVYLERPERRSIAGNIYKGVVDNVLPGMEAAFVEIGLEKN